jgi:RNA polymerase sigma factor (sigma-70 family)
LEDTAIIDLYWARNETALSESNSKYGGFCYGIAQNILFSREDAEECVNDTWLRAWNAIPPAKPSPLRAFFGRITRNLSLDRFRAAKAQKRGGGQMEALLDELYECVPSQGSVEGDFDARQTAAVITRFLDTLPPSQRQIFLRRYWFGDGVGAIASRFAMQEGTVKSNLFRVREKLRRVLEQEGVAL